MSGVNEHIVIVSTADWDNPFWTNKQHVALELARRGHKVFYIESQGLRLPSATGRDLKRIWVRLKRGLGPPRRIGDNIWVWSPILVPVQGSKAVRKLNRWLLSLGVGLWTRALGLMPKILWTYSPMTMDLYDVDHYATVVYHAVDDIKEQPRMPKESIRTAEDALSRRADVIFTTSHHLQQHHAALNAQTHYFPNVADFDHFNRALAPGTVVPADLAEIRGPRIGFVGAISSYKLDFPLIRALADSRPYWSFVLVGEVGEGDPLTNPALLKSAPNIHFLGPRPYATLPAYLKGIDVAILPNCLNGYTRSMFPMKFFEYLAAGCPVVSTPLPALSDRTDVALFGEGFHEFSGAIERALAGQGPSLEARLAAAHDNTYASRTEKMMQIVARLIEGRSGGSERDLV